ncbi:MAG: hypothetical protein ACP5E5_14345 [Acidobacteriaceae bacterium]
MEASAHRFRKSDGMVVPVARGTLRQGADGIERCKSDCSELQERATAASFDFVPERIHLFFSQIQPSVETARVIHWAADARSAPEREGRKAASFAH